MFLAETLEYDPAAVEKFLKDEKVQDYLRSLASRLESLPDFTLQTTEAAVRGLAGELAIKPGVLMNAARVALTGQTVAPGLFDVMTLLGREKTVERLRKMGL